METLQQRMGWRLLSRQIKISRQSRQSLRPYKPREVFVSAEQKAILYLTQEFTWRLVNHPTKLLGVNVKRHGDGFSMNLSYLTRRKKQLNYWQRSSTLSGLLWGFYTDMTRNKVKLSPNRYPMDLDKFDDPFYND